MPYLRFKQEGKITKESYGGKVKIAVLFNRFNEQTSLDKAVANAIGSLTVNVLTTKLSN